MSLIPLLQSLKTIDDLKRLAVDHLNFSPASRSIRSVFSERIGEEIQSAEIIAEQDDFKIIHCHLRRLLKGIERPAVYQIAQYYPHNLVIFSNSVPQEFHFTHLRRVVERKGGAELKTRPFRRIVVGPYEQLRTADERLSFLRIDGTESPLEIHAKCDEAFDVEAVTREFYKDFVDHYKYFRGVLEEENDLEQEAADRHTQTIFNRLFFLYFIQKKGYLAVNRYFLKERFDAIGKGNYYRDVILPLFQTLSIPDLIPEGFDNIPFLNGGLFEFSDEENRMEIPNEAFGTIINNLFNNYNFTVREDTEFEKEVAIDPEMMGTIFERLILGLESKKFEDIPDPRRASGSYYTPKFIVAFMVKQSLLNYLANQFPEVERSQLRNIIFHLEIDELTKEVLTKVRDKLLDIKVVDPGVGSGAYPVGLLLKMLDIIQAIDQRLLETAEAVNHSQGDSVSPDLNRGITYENNGTVSTVSINPDDKNYRYHLKRKIIENCLYGVDIQERAVELANLRLWLSLIVDLEVDAIEEIPPLPNLDYHIVCGDSLISQIAGYSFDVERRTRLDKKGTELLDRFQKLKAAYSELVTIEEKEKAKEKIAATKKNLLVWFLEKLKEKEEFRLSSLEAQSDLFEEDETSKQRGLDLKRPIKERIAIIEKHLQEVDELTAPFNWGLDFFEIIELRGGFDIVIANPPYGVKVDTEVRDEFGVQSKDSYGVFAVLGLRILKHGGTLCYIMSDTWQTIRTHKKLRNIFLKETDAQYLISVPSDIFAATVNTGVYSFVKRLKPRERFDDNGDNWLLAADFSPLKIRQQNGKLDSGDLEAAFELLIEEDTFDETKDGYTIESNRDFAIFAYRQKLIPRFSNHSFFIASPKLFGLMRDVGNKYEQTGPTLDDQEKPPIYKIDYNGKEREILKFANASKTLGGVMSSDNRRFLGIREGSSFSSSIYRTIPSELIVKRVLTEDEKLNGINNREHYVWIDKGGVAVKEGMFSNYFVRTDFLIDWSIESVRVMRQNNGLRNQHHYFKYGIVYSEAGINSPTFRLSCGQVFAKASPCIFVYESYGNNEEILGLLCSKLSRFLFKNYVNHTVHTVMEDIGEFIVINKMKCDDIGELVTVIIKKQKSNPQYNYMTNEQIEIDRLVYQMYNLNEEDIAEVETWFHRRYPKLARAIEAKLKEKSKGITET